MGLGFRFGFGAMALSYTYNPTPLHFSLTKCKVVAIPILAYRVCILLSTHNESYTDSNKHRENGVAKENASPPSPLFARVWSILLK